jgi:hypothetical protein
MTETTLKRLCAESPSVLVELLTDSKIMTENIAYKNAEQLIHQLDSSAEWWRFLCLAANNENNTVPGLIDLLGLHRTATALEKDEMEDVGVGLV